MGRAREAAHEHGPGAGRVPGGAAPSVVSFIPKLCVLSGC